MKNQQFQREQQKVKENLVSTEAEIRKILASTDFVQVEIGGRLVHSGIIEVVKKAAFIASEVGLGGCTSLSQFIKMIDDEDQMIVDLFQLFLTKKKATENGIEFDKDEEEIPDVVSTVEAPKKIVKSDAETLKQLLLDNGMAPAAIESMKADATATGVINSNRSYVGLTAKEINSPDFDIHKVMAEINEDLKHVKPFKMNFHTFRPKAPPR